MAQNLGTETTQVEQSHKEIHSASSACGCALRTASSPIVVVDGTVLVATMGATVAAATGVTGLKMGFCGRRIDDGAEQNLNDTFVFTERL